MTPELEKPGKLWEDYHRDGLGTSFAGNPTPVSCVVPVGKSIDAPGPFSVRKKGMKPQSGSAESGLGYADLRPRIVRASAGEAMGRP